MKEKLQRAIFAMGCFWGSQFVFDQISGVAKTKVGYCGGEAQKPTYEQVLTGRTGHVECVEVTFDPKKVNYEFLVKRFFENHNPTQMGGQGVDIGPQYKSVIFYMGEAQKKTANNLKDELVKKGFDIQTEIRRSSKFWPAEEYHQKYYEKSGSAYSCQISQKLF